MTNKWTSARLAVLVAAAVLLLVALAVSVAPSATAPTNIHPAVTALLTTQRSGTVSLIIGKQVGARDVEATAERLGAKITANWPFINAFAADVPVTAVRQLAMQPGVKMVVRDQPVRTTGRAGGGGGGGGSTPLVNTANLANTYNLSIGGDKVWAAGYNGAGVTVAVIDSGLNGGLADFGGRANLQVKINPLASYASDKHGHGSHVAGIIGGDGNLSNGKYLGMAPGVNMVSVKFSDDYGTATERDLVNGLQWVYDNRLAYNIRVVNISASTSVQSSYLESPTSAAVEQLWLAGVVVVVSAGNRGGEACSTCYAPANDPFVITVGAVTDLGTASTRDDSAVAWSSSGPTKDGHMKPDVAAPGAGIISTISSGVLADAYPQNLYENKTYFKMGGTSMSAPMVTGTVALMLQKNPSWTPDQVKWILMNTARTYRNQVKGTGGIVQADQAVLYTGTPGVANQGLTRSPYLVAGTGVIDYSTAMWSNAMWSNAMWSNNVNY